MGNFEKPGVGEGGVGLYRTLAPLSYQVISLFRSRATGERNTRKGSMPR